MCVLVVGVARDLGGSCIRGQRSHGVAVDVARISTVLEKQQVCFSYASSVVGELECTGAPVTD